MDAKQQRLTQWILAYHPSISTLPHTLDLIENRLIDSLRFTELILFIEQLTQTNIDMNTLDLADFKTIDSLSKRFLAQ